MEKLKGIKDFMCNSDKNATLCACSVFVFSLPSLSHSLCCYQSSLQRHSCVLI